MLYSRKFPQVPIIIESDYLNAISLCQDSQKNPSWDIEALIIEITQLLALTTNISFNHVPRALNKVADWITRNGQTLCYCNRLFNVQQELLYLISQEVYQ